MSRIFSSLSVASVLLILLALVYGLRNGDYNGLVNQLKQQRRGASSQNEHQVGQPGGGELINQSYGTRVPLATSTEIDPKLLAELRRTQWHVRNHMLLGVFAAVVTALVQCVGVTYFIGTGRWFKEVVDAYALDAGIVTQSTRIKRSSFPFAMLGIASILLIAALGAASDPGTLHEHTDRWVEPHYWTAILGMTVIGFALYRQALAIQRNQQLIDDVMQQVHDARVARNLEV